MTSHKRRGSALVEVSLLLTVLFFGTDFTTVEYVVESVPPILFAAARFTLAGLLLLPAALLSGPAGRLARRDLLPMLGLVGVGAIVHGSLGFAGTSLAGDALILAAAVCWGSYTILALSFLGRYSAVAAYAMTFGGLAAFPLAALNSSGLDLSPIDGLTWAVAAYSALCSSAFGFAAWGCGVSHGGAGQLVGAAVILLGVYLARSQ